MGVVYQKKTMVDLQAAVNLAWVYHRDQKRWNGSPYIFHPLQVMLNVGPAIETKIVAVCHDLLEDTDIKFPTLVTHIGLDLAEKVRALTRDPAKTYEEYIKSIIELDDPMVTEVKMADLKHNLMTIHCAPNPSKAKSLQSRYEDAWNKLASSAIHLG